MPYNSAFSGTKGGTVLDGGNNQSVKSSAPIVSRCFPGGYNVRLYISRGRVAWWLLTFFAQCNAQRLQMFDAIYIYMKYNMF